MSNTHTHIPGEELPPFDAKAFAAAYVSGDQGAPVLDTNWDAVDWKAVFLAWYEGRPGFSAQDYAAAMLSARIAVADRQSVIILPV